MKLENKYIELQLADIPYINSYVHKKTGVTINLPQNDVSLIINGQILPFDSLDIKTKVLNDSVEYCCEHKQNEYSFLIKYTLSDSHIMFKFEVVSDKNSFIKTVDFDNMPLIELDNYKSNIYRDIDIQDTWELNDRLKGGGRGLHYSHNQKGRIVDLAHDNSLVSCMHACVYDKICLFLDSNYPVLPYKSKITESKTYKNRGGSFKIALNTYQYRVRDKVLPPLKAKIVLLDDINGDNIANECDYLLYLNRNFEKPNNYYLDKIWYKIFCCDNKGNVKTSLDEAEKIIKAIYNITDGIPQIAYLCGWQLNGHDTLYPALNVTNKKLGDAKDFNLLSKKVRENYNTNLSYHINIDDSYESSPDFDENLLCKDVDGSNMVWLDIEDYENNPAYHINHTKDAESGSIFKRLDEFFDLLDVQKTVHTDAIRITNESWENDEYIGVMEELKCGLEPIFEYLKTKDIDASAEGINGMPIDGPGYFSAFYHNSMGMLYHGKLLSGGYCQRNNWSWGNGAAIDTDITYKNEENCKDTGLNFTSNINGIIDTIYCGALLYQFLIQHEMLNVSDQIERLSNESFLKRTITMSDDIIINMTKETDDLLIKQGDVIIASGYDRFIPLNNGIYCYSRLGFDGEYILPKEYQNEKLLIKKLSINGCENKEQVQVKDNLRLDIKGGKTIKIEKIINL